jgi:EmrB/QacA subfamily drug resistance transporter
MSVASEKKIGSPQDTTLQTNFGSLSKKQIIGTVIGLQLALLLAALDQTIVSTAMPRIIAQLNGFGRYAWVTTAYLLTSTAAVPIFGKLSDMYGRKWYLLGGATCFVLTSALCGAAGQFAFVPFDGMTQLIIARGLQGIAGGALLATVFSSIGDLFPPRERGKYMGLFSAVWAFASMVGPVLGGWLTDQLSWRWIFYVNLPVGAVAITVLYKLFPHVPARGKRKIDYLGAALLIAFLAPLLLAVQQVGNVGWLAPAVILPVFFSVVMLGLFIWAELKAVEPIMPPELLAIPEVCRSLFALCCNSVGMFSTILFAPLFMQVVLGVSPTKAGSLFTPLMLMMALCSASGGFLVSRTGRYKVMAIIGLTVLTGALFLLSRLDETSSQTYLVVLLMMIGAGLGSTMPVFNLQIQNAAPQGMIGAATAMSQFFRSVGATIGAAILGSMMQSTYIENLKHSNLPEIPLALSQQLTNPARLAQSKEQILAAYSGNETNRALINMVFDHVNQALVKSIDLVFLLSAIVVLLSLVVAFFINEKPLRGGEPAARK